MSLEAAVIASIESGRHLTTQDQGLVVFAVELAKLLDVLLADGDAAAVSRVGPVFRATMVELQLSPESRAQGKQEADSDGSNHIGAYLRLVAPEAGQPKAGAAKRGSGGK